MNSKIVGTVLIVAVLLVAPLSPTHAQSDDLRNGNWWRQLSADRRLYYVVGMMDGMPQGVRWVHDANSAEAGKRLGSFFGHITNGQLVDGINKFYDDYRNRLICANDGMWLVVLDINGELTAGAVEYERKSAH